VIRKGKLIYCLVLPVLLLLFGCSRGKVATESRHDSVLLAISDYLEWEGENGFDGVVLVKTPGNDPLIRSFGYAYEEQQVPNSPETAFDIGSITKQFTAAAILKLQMQGKLNVDDSIGSYLPSLPADKRGITFHQLLTHTAGLPTDVGSDTEVVTRDVLISRLFEVPLVSTPGSGYHYSHAGYNLLGLLIEGIAGTDYESFLREFLFKPAHMHNTGYRAPGWSFTRIAHGYRYCNDWGGPMDSGWLEDGPSWNRRASGGMLSTIIDLYAWHEALSGNDILDEKAKSSFYYPHDPVRINEVQTSAYGWRIIKTTRQTNVIAHNGWNGRFYSDFLRYLDDDVTIILLSNKFREGNQSVPLEIAKCIFWKNYKPRLSGALTQCLDSLPDNRIGDLSGRFLKLLANGADRDFREFAEKCLASHLIKKFGNDTLVSRLKDLQKTTGPVRIRQVMITDNQLMNIEIHQLGNEREAFIQLYFDKNEDYLIRGFRVKSADDSN
jgi:CubicO group peptidase (beta-lactamase class C family)